MINILPIKTIIAKHHYRELLVMFHKAEARATTQRQLSLSESSGFKASVSLGATLTQFEEATINYSYRFTDRFKAD